MRIKNVYGDTAKIFLAANNGTKPITECDVKIFRFQYPVKKMNRMMVCTSSSLSW